MLWIEREKKTNTEYGVTGFVLCLILHIREDVFNYSNANNNNHFILLSRPFLFHSYKKSYMKSLTRSGLNKIISIVSLILLTVTNLSEVVKKFMMLIVIHGIRNTLYHAPNSLVHGKEYF